MWGCFEMCHLQAFLTCAYSRQPADGPARGVASLSPSTSSYTNRIRKCTVSASTQRRLGLAGKTMQADAAACRLSGPRKSATYADFSPPMSIYCHQVGCLQTKLTAAALQPCAALSKITHACAVTYVRHTPHCPPSSRWECHRASNCTTRRVRFLYRMRYPHSLHLITSPCLITFSWPQSPQV